METDYENLPDNVKKTIDYHFWKGNMEHLIFTGKVAASGAYIASFGAACDSLWLAALKDYSWGAAAAGVSLFAAIVSALCGRLVENVEAKVAERNTLELKL